MPVLVVENRAPRQPRLLDLNEGLGRVLRYGAFAPGRARSPALVPRRRSGPALGEALRRDRRDRRARADRPGAADGRRVPQPQPRRLRAADQGARAPRSPALDLPRGRAAARPRVRRRQRALLPERRHGGVQVARATPRTACPGSSLVTAMARNGTDFGIRVSGLGDRWFTGPAGTPVGLYFAGLRAGGRQPRHRRQRDHRDRRARRLRDGRRAGHRAVRRRHARGRAALHAADVRDHARRERRLPDPRARLPRHADGHRRAPGRSRPGSCRRSTPASPIAQPGIGQIGAGLVTPPRECFEAAGRALAAALPA